MGEVVVWGILTYVLCFCLFQGKLLVGINSRVGIYKWAETDEGTRDLVSECTHSGHVLALYLASRGDFIVVGELIGLRV